MNRKAGSPQYSKNRVIERIERKREYRHDVAPGMNLLQCVPVSFTCNISFDHECSVDIGSN